MNVENGKQPAFPFVEPLERCSYHCGLTKREYFAAMAMQGYCANSALYMAQSDRKADWAKKDADALLKALEESEASNG